MFFRPFIKIMILICLFIFTAMLLNSCSGGGGEGNGDNGGGTGVPTLPELVTKVISIAPQVLDDYNIDYQGFTAMTLFGEVQLVSNGGADTRATPGLEVVDGAQSQIIFIEDLEGNVVVAALIKKDEVVSGLADIRLESIADAFIWLNEIIMNYSASDRELIIAQARSSSNYELLKSEIETALQEEPTSLLEEAVFPQIYEYAYLALVDALKILGIINDPVTIAATRITYPDPALGSLDGLYISQPGGIIFQYVNPTMVFYAVETAAAGINIVSGKETLFTLTGGLTDPVIEDFYLIQEGLHQFRMTNGMKFDLNDPAVVMAAGANVIKLIQLIIDSVAICPVENAVIEELVENGLTATFFDSELISIINEGKSPKFITEKLIDYILDADHWRKITQYLYANAGNKARVIKFLKNAKKILKALAKVLVIYDAVQKSAPFLYDLFNSPNDYTLCGTLLDQELTPDPDCQEIPPTAVISRTTPDPLYTGNTVAFDSSQSYDDSVPTNELSVRWDFNGDGVFDTNWSTVKTAQYTYNNVGIYTVCLEVRDYEGVNGLIGTDYIDIYITSNTAFGGANHIKVVRDVLPWSYANNFGINRAFEETVDALGLSEGSGADQYEFISSASLSTEILEPGEDMVIIINDQDQNFYDQLALYTDRVERFLQNGGIVLWEACDRGWNNGSMAAAGIVLPRNVTYTDSYDLTNTVINFDSPLTSGLNTVLTGYYASHEAFQNLPVDSVSYLVNESNIPTLVEYEVDRGWTILTGSPLEHAVWSNKIWDENYTMAAIYPRLMEYVLGKATNVENRLQGETSSPSFTGLPSYIPR